ncbi:hypothetical protein [Halorussus litoreus]|nr:hypothetical protein [Halorussus litoreus]
MSRTGHAAPADSTADASFSKRFLALFALGMVGVSAVTIVTA